jgi:ABC-2 type transport system ATP-binding protein
VQEKSRLMRELGKRQLVLQLQEPLATVPEQLNSFELDIAANGHELVYTYDTQAQRTGITALLGALNQADIKFNDLTTSQSSLEEIFVGLVKKESA